MKTPFTIDQFFAVFEKYNTAVYPAQIIFFVAGISAIAFLHSVTRNKGKIITIILSALWLWNSLVYHLMFFSTINKAAVGFCFLFFIQAVLMLYESLVKRRLDFGFGHRIKDYAGYGFVLYGLFLYPVIDLLAGHDITGVISLGLPCPTNHFDLWIFSAFLSEIPALSAHHSFPLGIDGSKCCIEFWYLPGFCNDFSSHCYGFSHPAIPSAETCHLLSKRFTERLVPP